MLDCTEDGYYWLLIEGEKPLIVSVYDFDIDDPTVAFMGSPYDMKLSDCVGAFQKITYG